jgi:probable F420-dependent oxidoreductase
VAAGDVAAAARRAERDGFDAVACGEHIFFHGPVPNAFVSLAAAAGATQRIRLLSALTVLPVYPVALAAKLAATLDRVSGGRLDLGVGIGGEYPPEFDAVGVPVRERGRRTDEALELLGLLFRGEPVDYAGRYTTLRGQRLAPTPVQRPGPPVWIGGRREASARRAGRFGDVWVPYLVTPEQLADGLRTASASADEHGRPAPAGAVFCWSCVAEDGAWARRTAVETVGAGYQQDFSAYAGRYLLTGTPAEVVARLREYRDAGAETVVFAPACAPDDLDTVVRSFTEHVLPEL